MASDTPHRTQSPVACEGDLRDNQGAIALSRNPGFHARSKHIDIRYHVIRNHVDEETGTINLHYCPTEDMTAKVLTKGLSSSPHHKHSAGMGLI